MKFRKKPVVIEAVRFDPADHAAMFALIGWLDRHGAAFDQDEDHLDELIIGALEDGSEGQAKHVATAGDWIIRDEQGEFSRCEPDIFAATYEAVPDGEEEAA